jgi:hypothetical protein
MDREMFLSQDAWTMDQKDIGTITHILVRLQILDQFVDALSFPPNPSLRVMSKIRFPHKMSEPVERVFNIYFSFNLALTPTQQIFNHLKDWSEPIEGLRRAFAALQSGSKKSKGKGKGKGTVIPDFSSLERDIPLPESPTQEAILTRSDILTLWRAFRHTVSGKLHIICSHVEILTSSVSWFSQVCSVCLSQKYVLMCNNSVTLTSQSLLPS